MSNPIFEYVGFHEFPLKSSLKKKVVMLRTIQKHLKNAFGTLQQDTFTAPNWADLAHERRAQNKYLTKPLYFDRAMEERARKLATAGQGRTRRIDWILFKFDHIWVFYYARRCYVTCPFSC